MRFKSTLGEIMHNFLELRETSCSKSCYDHDKWVIGSFDKYLSENGFYGNEITEILISHWIKTLKGKSGTVANKVIILRIFLKFCEGYGYKVFYPPIPKVHDDYMPYIFSDDEINRILFIADSMENNLAPKYKFTHIEIPMVLRLMYGCGLRIGETLSIKMKDVNLENGFITLKKTKRNKERIVPMHNSLSEIAAKYCYAMGIVGNPEFYLFPADSFDNHLSVKAAKHRFDRILKQAGIEHKGNNFHERGACLHCIRHVFAFKSFAASQKAGVPLNDTVPYLSIYLGHDSLNETEKYLKFSSDLFPDAMELFDDYSSDVLPEVNYDE